MRNTCYLVICHLVWRGQLPPWSSQTTCLVLYEADGPACFLKAAQQPLSFDRMPPNANSDRAIVTPRLLFLMLLSIISCLLVLLNCPHYCCLHVPAILAGLALGLCCASRYGILIYSQCSNWVKYVVENLIQLSKSGLEAHTNILQHLTDGIFNEKS